MKRLWAKTRYDNSHEFGEGGKRRQLDGVVSGEGFRAFLREAAPLLGLQWRPFQRKGIKRKVERRIIEAGLSGFDDYLSRIKEDPEERNVLSRILKVTISRFFRDREVFGTIAGLFAGILRERGPEEIKVWSIGCASGEEPYSLSLLWKQRFEADRPETHLTVLATEVDEGMLHRAKAGRYKKSSLSEVPAEILQKFFKAEGDLFVIEKAVREGIEFRRHDILREEPFSGMDMVFCRNLAFTYFSKESQVIAAGKIWSSLRGNGYLVIGKDESLPLIYPALFTPAFLKEKIFRKLASSPVVFSRMVV